MYELFNLLKNNNPLDITKIYQYAHLINVKDNFFNNCLHIAIQCSHSMNVIKILTSLGADVNGRNIFAETPLHLAVDMGDYSTCYFLLENGADPNAINNHCQAPIHIAILNSLFPILQLLIAKGAKITKNKIIELFIKEWQHDADAAIVFPFLINTGLNIAEFKGFLHWLDDGIYEEICDTLNILDISLIVNYTIHNKTPLSVAIHNYEIKVVKYLISHNAYITHPSVQLALEELKYYNINEYNDLMTFILS